VDGTVKAAAFVGDGSGLTALPGGSGKYIQNQVAAVQAGAGFSIGGNALVGGRVGIGTTSPSHQLHLTGSMRIEDKQDIVFYNTGGEVYQGIIYADEAAKRFLVHTGDDRHLWFGSQGKGYNIRFNTNEGTWKERMVIQSGGNVGIGTATPSATLDVAGGARVSGTAGLASTILSGSGTAITASQEGGTGYNFIGKNAGANTFRVMNTGNLLLDVPAGSGGTPALSVNNAGAGPAAVFSGGNVGIGKSTPDALLDVYEGMKFGSGKPDYNVIVVAASSMGFPASDGTLDNWSSNGAYWAMPMVYRSRPGGAFPFDRYGELILQGTSHGTSYNRGISLATTPQATNVPAIRMRITEGGAVGIGTTSPSAKLDLDGASGDALLRLRVSKTPTSSADPSGNVGSFAWDDNYVYMKTNKGWRRAALGAF
jgi:hypothetical protein